MIISASAVRPYPGYRCSGDAAVIVPRATGCLIALVDALGHGEAAAASAERAVATIREHAEAQPSQILHACHLALRHVRGAAVAVLAIDDEGNGRFAGVGNIRVRIVPESMHQGALLSSSGVVGQQIRNIREHGFKLPLDSLGVVHSDGVSSRIDPLGIARAPIDQMANELLKLGQRDNDDASLILFARARGLRAEKPSA